MTIPVLLLIFALLHPCVVGRPSRCPRPVSGDDWPFRAWNVKVTRLVPNAVRVHTELGKQLDLEMSDEPLFLQTQVCGQEITEVLVDTGQDISGEACDQVMFDKLNVSLVDGHIMNVGHRNFVVHHWRGYNSKNSITFKVKYMECGGSHRCMRVSSCSRCEVCEVSALAVVRCSESVPVTLTRDQSDHTFLQFTSANCDKPEQPSSYSTLSNEGKIKIMMGRDFRDENEQVIRSKISQLSPRTSVGRMQPPSSSKVLTETIAESGSSKTNRNDTTINESLGAGGSVSASNYLTARGNTINLNVNVGATQPRIGEEVKQVNGTSFEKSKVSESSRTKLFDQRPITKIISTRDKSLTLKKSINSKHPISLLIQKSDENEQILARMTIHSLNTTNNVLKCFTATPPFLLIVSNDKPSTLPLCIDRDLDFKLSCFNEELLSLSITIEFNDVKSLPLYKWSAIEAGSVVEIPSSQSAASSLVQVDVDEPTCFAVGIYPSLCRAFESNSSLDSRVVLNEDGIYSVSQRATPKNSRQFLKVFKQSSCGLLNKLKLGSLRILERSNSGLWQEVATFVAAVIIAILCTTRKITCAHNEGQGVVIEEISSTPNNFTKKIPVSNLPVTGECSALDITDVQHQSRANIPLAHAVKDYSVADAYSSLSKKWNPTLVSCVLICLPVIICTLYNFSICGKTCSGFKKEKLMQHHIVVFLSVLTSLPLFTSLLHLTRKLKHVECPVAGRSVGSLSVSAWVIVIYRVLATLRVRCENCSFLLPSNTLLAIGLWCLFLKGDFSTFSGIFEPVLISVMFGLGDTVSSLFVQIATIVFLLYLRVRCIEFPRLWRYLALTLFANILLVGGMTVFHFSNESRLASAVLVNRILHQVVYRDITRAGMRKTEQRVSPRDHSTTGPMDAPDAYLVVAPNADPEVAPNAAPVVSPNAAIVVAPNADLTVATNADLAVTPNADPVVVSNTHSVADPITLVLRWGPAGLKLLSLATFVLAAVVDEDWSIMPNVLWLNQNQLSTFINSLSFYLFSLLN